MTYSDPEQRAAYDKAYYEKHKEKRAAYHKAWYQAHKEKRAAYHKAWRDAHREEWAAYYRAYRKAHKKAACDENTGGNVMYSCDDCFYFGEEHEGAFYCAFDTEHTHPMDIDAGPSCFMKQDGLRRWLSMFDKPRKEGVFDKLP